MYRVKISLGVSTVNQSGYFLLIQLVLILIVFLQKFLTMNTVFTSLELDKEDINSKLICIINEELCETNFAVNSFVSDAVRSENSSLCLVSLHRSFEHYNLVGVKSGYNLNSWLQKGNLIRLDITKEILNRINNFPLDKLIDDGFIVDIALRIQSNIEELNSKFDKVVLIVDSLSDLLNAGGSLNSVLLLAHHLRILISKYPKTVLILISQSSEEESDKNRLKNYLLNTSDFRIIVSPLKTGFSTQVSGFIKYSKKDDKSIKTWSNEHLYHFKVTDRNIKIFPPGSITV